MSKPTNKTNGRVRTTRCRYGNGQRMQITLEAFKEKGFENVTREEEATQVTRRFEMEPNITSRETKYDNHNQKHSA